MAESVDERDSLGHAMFNGARLGDRRRAARAAKVFDALRQHPGGTLPDKLAAPADLKALYRLCACEQVTHQALLASIRAHALGKLAAHEETILFIHDATELNYTSRKAMAEELGQVARGLGTGFICQNVLAVHAASGDVLGLMDQILHRRARVAKNEKPAERRARNSRESRLWAAGTRHLPVGKRYVDVADQGADAFEFIEHAQRSGRTFVIRVHHARKLQRGHDGAHPVQPLSQCAAGLPELGRFTIDVQPQKNRPARRNAAFVIRGADVLVHPPHFRAGDHGKAALALYLVTVTEEAPPAGAKPIVWQLLTNQPVATLQDAQRVTSWYERRWIVEEFHKAQKTGCGIENLQFTAAARLEPAIALLSAVALTLLDLRDASRRPDAHTRPATQIIDHEYVTVLTAWRFGKPRLEISVHDFYLALARLGGHQNRRHDHPPGWLVLWRGWTKLQPMLTGYETSQRQKCG